MIHTNEQQTQFTKHAADLITNLNREINIDNSLLLIDNAMWSLKTLVTDNKDLDQNVKKQYNELFEIMINRFERVTNAIEADLNGILKISSNKSRAL